MIDLLASEYGWQIEYIDKLPEDVALNLIHAILKRKNVKTERTAHATPTGFLKDRIKEIIDTAAK